MRSTPNYTGSFDPHDEKWYSQLYDKHFQTLLYTSGQMISNEVDAAETVSDCFLKVWQAVQMRPGEFTDIIHVRNYLYATVRNACTDYLRKGKVDIVDAADVQEIDGPDTDRFITILEDRDTLQHVITIIGELPPSLREIIQLSFLEGMSVDEIARKLDRPVGSIRVDKTRGLDKLRELVKGKGQTLSPNVALLLLYWIYTTA